MGVWNDFPYTDFHAQNLDFLLNLASRLDAALADGLTTIINAWVDANYNTLFFNASYEPDTETITFARNS